ncbi:MAG: hypothetical protein IJM76_07265 [Lachnospiraceae bacterium]|nr:hypothetical protein [Lachnospiraceae bacterium]
MKTTLEALWAQYNESQVNAAKRNEEIKQTEAVIAGLKAEREKAAEDGDLDLYDKKDNEIQQTEHRLYVLIKSAKKGAVTPEQTAEFWREYAAGFQKNQEKRLAEYRKTQKKAREQYEELVQEQNRALHAREDLGIMTGIFDGSDATLAEVEQSYELPVTLPGKDINRTISDLPEYVFFTSVSEWEGNKANDTLNMVVRLGRAVDNPDFGHK